MKFLSVFFLGAFFAGMFSLQHKTALEARMGNRLEEEVVRNRVCDRALDILSVRDKWLKIFALRDAAREANRRGGN